MLHLSVLPHQLHALLHFQRCFAVAGGSGGGSSSSSSSSSVSTNAFCSVYLRYWDKSTDSDALTGTKVQILTPVQLLGAQLPSFKY
jgi:hypothetical protein